MRGRTLVAFVLAALLVSLDGSRVSGRRSLVRGVTLPARFAARVLLHPLRALRERTLRSFIKTIEQGRVDPAERLRLRRIQHLPKRIILVRHGESIGNRNKMLYSRVPDPSMALTDHGFAQAQVAGRLVAGLVGDEPVKFYFSPYMRARQSVVMMLRAFENRTQPIPLRSEPRLREQDFGNFQDFDMMRDCLDERQRYGRFFFRIPNGEAGTDVRGEHTCRTSWPSPTNLISCVQHTDRLVLHRCTTASATSGRRCSMRWRMRPRSPPRPARSPPHAIF
jgi:hypothetical protein